MDHKGHAGEARHAPKVGRDGIESLCDGHATMIDADLSSMQSKYYMSDPATSGGENAWSETVVEVKATKASIQVSKAGSLRPLPFFANLAHILSRYLPSHRNYNKIYYYS